MNNRERVLLLKIKENFQLKITVSNPPNNQFNHLAKSLVNQFVGVSNGLKLMQSQNFVKVRTDEVYALSKYVDAICCSQTIFQSSNFIVKGFSYHKFCISDHLFSAPKDKMLEAIDWVLSATYEELGAQLGKDIKVPESILGYSLLYVTLRNQ
jgi:hypothetical protein